MLATITHTLPLPPLLHTVKQQRICEACRLDGRTSVGFFLGTARAFVEITNSVTQVYSSLIALASVVPSLKALTRLLNMPTDVLDQKEMLRAQMEVNDGVRVMLAKQQQEEYEKTAWPKDWTYPGVRHLDSDQPLCLECGSRSVLM